MKMMRTHYEDCVLRAVEEYQAGNTLAASYWQGYAAGIAAAMGRGLSPNYDLFRALLTEARQYPLARRGDAEQVTTDHRVAMFTKPEGKALFAQACGTLTGFYDFTADAVDAAECAGCGERILADDPAEDYATCPDHGSIHQLCQEGICSRWCMPADVEPEDFAA